MDCYRIVWQALFMDIKEIGQRIRALREGQHVTQDQLAAKMDVSRATVSHWEAGNRVIPLDEFLKLSQILGVNPAHLIDPDCPMGGDPIHKDLLKQTLDVLDSRTEYSAALESNIKAFYSAVITEIQTEERIARIEDLMKRGGGGSGGGGPRPPGPPMGGLGMPTKRGRKRQRPPGDNSN